MGRSPCLLWLQKVLLAVFLLVSAWQLCKPPAITPPPPFGGQTSTLPVRSDGVVFVSNGAAGAARDASFSLAQHGYHVLLGVRNKRERGSFSYVSRKGIELIDFDMEDQGTYPGLVDRLRTIRRDLDRPLIGIVLNTATASLVGGTNVCKEGATLADMRALDECYRKVVKPPVRLLQALWELRRLQSVQGLSSRLLASAATLAQEPERWDAEGMRIVLATRSLSSDDGDGALQSVLQEATERIFHAFASESNASNYSVSIVPLMLAAETVADTSAFASIPWAIETASSIAGVEDEEDRDQQIHGALALQHAIMARRPRRIYSSSSQPEL